MTTAAGRKAGPGELGRSFPRADRTPNRGGGPPAARARAGMASGDWGSRWSRPAHPVLRSPRAEARARPSRGTRVDVRPVFVDDSGRRHRMARAVGVALAVITVSYVGIVTSALSGVPGLGTLVLPGLADLARPARADSATVGADPVVRPVQVVAGDSTSQAPDQVAATSPTTVSPTSTTSSSTTTSPGGGSTTTEPSPSSTVPSRSGNGGPPITPPGHT